MFELVSQMLLELGISATPAKVALAIGGLVLVALAVVIVVMVV